MDPMQNPSPEAAAQPRAASPGQMLRVAREAKGLHLAVLSVALKVPTRQLEALEADRYDAFRGVTFVRALAQTVCRHLGLDPAPVLAGLPKATSPLQQLPLRPVDPALAAQAASWPGTAPKTPGVSRPVWLLGGLMLAGSAGLIWWPAHGPDLLARAGWTQASVQAPEPVQQASEANDANGANDAPAAAASAQELQTTVAAAPVVSASVQPQASAPAPVAATSQEKPPIQDAPLVMRASSDGWVTVRDSRGEILFNRQVKAGETLKLDIAAPLFVYAGRADGLELVWRGKPVDLKPFTQNNEVRLPIKP